MAEARADSVVAVTGAKGTAACAWVKEPPPAEPTLTLRSSVSGAWRGRLTAGGSARGGEARREEVLCLGPSLEVERGPMCANTRFCMGRSVPALW